MSKKATLSLGAIFLIILFLYFVKGMNTFDMADMVINLFK